MEEQSGLSILATKPDWLYRAVNNAVPFMKRDHGVAESLLGIAKVFEAGDEKEAKRLYDEQLAVELEVLSSDPSLVGELNSTQIRKMMSRDEYPDYMKSIIKNVLGPEITTL